MTKTYSKAEELEADREGIEHAVHASYSPLGALRLFEMFQFLAQRKASGLPPGRGIGSALSERATEEACALGFSELYLFTFSKQSFYARLGWSHLEDASYAGVPGTIMEQTLVAPPPCKRCTSDVHA